jgi:hypothetical protein
LIERERIREIAWQEYRKEQADVSWFFVVVVFIIQYVLSIDLGVA